MSLEDMMHDRELKVHDVADCADQLTIEALQGLTGRPNVLARHVRDWMAENASGTSTERPEFQEAVLHLLEHRLGIRFIPVKPVFGRVQ